MQRIQRTGMEPIGTVPTMLIMQGLTTTMRRIGHAMQERRIDTQRIQGRHIDGRISTKER
jgi:hypothetical protein